MKTLGIKDAISRDLLYAFRTLQRNQLFAIVAVLVMALGIGANTACFSVIRSVLLRPLEYKDPDRLVIISGGATPVRLEEMKSAARSFTAIGAFTGQEDITLTGGDQPKVLKAARVSSTFSGILGVIPVLGRAFLPEEDMPGGPPVVMISADLWRTHFHGDLDIIGKTIDLGGTPHTVVSVLPTGFNFPFPGLDVWLAKPAEWPAIPPKSRPLSPFLTVFARLSPEVSIQEANAEALVLHQQYARTHPAMLDAKPKSVPRVRPLKEHIVGNIRSELWLIFGAVAFVLLIACANLASLLLARAHARSREFAVRAALGASRRQLTQQLLTESVLLSLMGGTLGFLMAIAGVNALRSMTTWTLPRVDEIHLSAAVLIFAAMLSCTTGLLTGFMPALTAARTDLMFVLRARTAGGNQVNFRGLLVAGQVALSTVLLIGAALLLESVARLRSEDLGFDPSNLITARISLPPQQYDTDYKKVDFFENLIRLLKAQPGIAEATAAMTLPMTGYAGSPVQDADKPILRLNERVIATILVVSPGYFETFRIPLKRGRLFTARDRDTNQGVASRRVAVIDEGLARRFWPGYPRGEDPIGHRLLIGGTNLQPAEIIGVVGNVHQNVDNTGWPESVYIALSQNALPSALLAVRTTGDPTRATATLRETLHQLDRNQPLADIQTMENLVEAQLGERRVLLSLLGSFATVATLLAVIGIYGIASYSVMQRTQEIGIRRALGAQEADVIWLIIRQSLVFASIGTLLGLCGAFGLTRYIRSLLFHISATDPTTMAGIAVLFIVVAVLSSYLPARQATDVDPMVALRYE